MHRRQFLRNSGIALAMPWFESLRAATTESPTRFGLVYFSNGVEPAHWWANGAGTSMEVGPGLAPMQPLTEHFSFLRGLYNQKAAETSSPHLGAMPNLLSGAEVSLDPAVIRVGKTFDQVLAQRIGGRTEIPSLVLGIEPNELRLEDGVSMIYGSAISWTSEVRPATKEIYPARVFDRLVGNDQGRELDRSILDTLLDQARSLRSQVSHSDRAKLEEYLESIRDIERRIDLATKQERLEGWRPSLAEPNMERPASELPQEVPEHMRLMLDLIVLAYRMDKTRIATLMLNNDLSQMNFGFLDGVEGALHLDLTHNGKDPELEAMYLRTNQFHVEQFAYLVRRLSEIDEGGKSLLDSSMLIGCSNLFDGDRHQADEMPFLLAGRGGGLRPGQVLDYLSAGDDNRRACSLYLSLMDRMGVRLDRFGDSRRRLDKI